jgi:hypothetical protein
VVRREGLKSEGFEGRELVDGRSHVLLVEGCYGCVVGGGGGDGGHRRLR